MGALKERKKNVNRRNFIVEMKMIEIIFYTYLFVKLGKLVGWKTIRILDYMLKIIYRTGFK
jgi:hypothetical protein